MLLHMYVLPRKPPHSPSVVGYILPQRLRSSIAKRRVPQSAPRISNGFTSRGSGCTYITNHFRYWYIYSM